MPIEALPVFFAFRDRSGGVELFADSVNLCACPELAESSMPESVAVSTGNVSFGRRFAALLEQELDYGSVLFHLRGVAE